jgi:hypothetical protein
MSYEDLMSSNPLYCISQACVLFALHVPIDMHKCIWCITRSPEGYLQAYRQTKLQIELKGEDNTLPSLKEAMIKWEKENEEAR